MDYRILILLAGVGIISIAGFRIRLLYEIQAASLLVTGSRRPGTTLYALIFLPGTLLHELSHWLMAEILQVPTGKFNILPDKEGEEERLGYVMTGSAGPFRSFLIGFAPFFTGILSIIILGVVLNDLWGTGTWWQIILTIYGLVVISNSMMVSRADRHNWPIIAILVILGIFIGIRLNLSLPTSAISTLQSVLLRIDQALGLTIGLNIGMILMLTFLRFILEKVTGKKVVFRR